MINQQKLKNAKKKRRKLRVRSKIFGTAKILRLSVFRSLKHISVQLIDDTKGKTLITADDKKIKGGKIERANEVGRLIAKKAIEKKIKKCIFDKGKYKYHGRVKAVADGAREGGLQF